MLTAQTFNSYTEQHRLSLKLRPILLGELYLAKKMKHPVYIFKNGIFYPVIKERSVPSKDQITSLLKDSYKEAYIHPEDFKDIKQNLEAALIKVTRSLSVGDPVENGNKDIKLLTLNLGSLYQNPHSDDLLMLQFQSAQNLAKFLLDNKKLQPLFFKNLIKEKFHFTLSQPMLSSILLLSYLQSIHLFQEREIESLFLASYLKDIGISLIPEEKYDIKVLTTRDQELFAKHADFSYDLLEGRVPISKNYLTIIKHHHFLNDKLKSLVSKDKISAPVSDIIFGIESTLVSVFDILAATTTDRPYRKGLSLYQAVELLKMTMSDDYPQEFKALVIFLKQFYKN